MSLTCKVGIMDYAVYVPEKTITAEELSKQVDIPAEVLRNKMGINRKYVGGPEDHPGMMATKASKALLEKTKIDPKSIDMILYAGETYSEYVCWTVGIKIQNEIGADNAYAWDLSFRCAGTPLALKVAKDMMKADDKLDTILVTGGNSNCYLVDYKNPLHSFMYDMAPSGFALLIKRNHPENEILESAIITEHEFCDDVIGKFGGTLYPITAEIASDPERLRTAKLVTLTDPDGMKKRLADKSMPAFTNAVRKALAHSKLNEKDVDFIGMTHINPKGHFAIMDSLGIDREKTVYLSDDGHCGHSDQWLALNHGISQGKVKDGDIVALLGAGTGYGFGCSLIRWGKSV